jgi:hypothetical protein
MAYETLQSIYPALLVGELPALPAHAWVGAGEELRELLRETAPQAKLDDEELERIKQSLIDFGALAADDMTTGLADLIEVLLPPANSGD